MLNFNNKDRNDNHLNDSQILNDIKDAKIEYYKFGGNPLKLRLKKTKLILDVPIVSIKNYSGKCYLFDNKYVV